MREDGGVEEEPGVGSGPDYCLFPLSSFFCHISAMHTSIFPRRIWLDGIGVSWTGLGPMDSGSRVIFYVMLECLLPCSIHNNLPLELVS
jgi:hypothetical protein